jgi:ribulose-phosphate 3-epimerase
MKIICPTVTAYEPHEYREQINRIIPFANRIHIDLMDGVFTETRSPSIDRLWLPESVQCDIHLMYQDPLSVISQVVGLGPKMVVIQAEAQDAEAAVLAIQQAGLKAGVSLLADTPVSELGGIIEHADHVLIFSGHLGYHGGEADLSLLQKVPEIRARNPHAEIGWDGGINTDNARQLVDAGIAVLNVGGFIQNAASPRDAYAKLLAIESQS